MKEKMIRKILKMRKRQRKKRKIKIRKRKKINKMIKTWKKAR